MGTLRTLQRRLRNRRDRVSKRRAKVRTLEVRVQERIAREIETLQLGLDNWEEEEALVGRAEDKVRRLVVELGMEELDMGFDTDFDTESDSD
jgi:hypothetical protein